MIIIDRKPAMNINGNRREMESLFFTVFFLLLLTLSIIYPLTFTKYCIISVTYFLTIFKIFYVNFIYHLFIKYQTLRSFAFSSKIKKAPITGASVLIYHFCLFSAEMRRWTLKKASVERRAIIAPAETSLR